MPGTLFVVATPIGNLEDITARALRVLREVSLIAAEDTRRTAQLLARYAITTPSTSLHEHNEERKTSSLVARLVSGADIALVSDAGTPTISDPGRRFIQGAIKADIRVETIPGPNAAVAALAASGFPVDSFHFMGFPPNRSNDRLLWFKRAREVGGTLVFYEAPHRILQTLQEFERAVGNYEALVCRELTKAHENLVRGSISQILAAGVTPIGEFTIVVNIGETTECMPAERPSDAEAFKELCHMTDNSQISRRVAVGRLAKRYNLPVNEVYAAIERGKKLVI